MDYKKLIQEYMLKHSLSVNQMAQKTGIGREILYRVLNDQGTMRHLSKLRLLKAVQEDECIS